ncbi:MAG: hypothetical protein OJF51_001099 [Nitrospira sp.]|jgi:hypothetical protein|nr:MAG: hypothetical protein OJF51_001099 [Nitrospira sp.]
MDYSTINDRYTFHLSIEPKETLVLAHCLELDIMSSGRDEDAAINELIKMIKKHMLFAFENNLPLYSPAPLPSWSRIQNQKGIILDIDFRHPRNESTHAQPFYKHRDENLCLA